MLTEQYKKMLSGKSVIRQLSEFATEKKSVMRMYLTTA